MRAGSAKLGARVFAALVVAGALTSTPAHAATQVGETFDPAGSGCGAGTRIQSGSPGNSYAVPFAGVITSWSFQASAAPPAVKLRLARALGSHQFALDAQSAVETPVANQLNVFATRLAVQAGELIGTTTTSSGDCLGTTSLSYTYDNFFSDPPPGTTAASDGYGSGIRIDVSATLETDCDNDGFGDETQDPDISSCPPAPETTITNGPKDKTKKKTATFEFTANDPAAAFECSLDGEAFRACSSPVTVKVKKGKHTFSVRATDVGGNVEGAPATDDWKVKKKRKRK
jgi:hypothetical protein